MQNQKLTAKEERVLEEKRKKLKYAEARKKLVDDLDNRDEYRMPSAYDQEGNVQQDQRYKVLTERYRCDSSSQDGNDSFQLHEHSRS